jgi:hypothetical protein
MWRLFHIAIKTAPGYNSVMAAKEKRAKRFSRGGAEARRKKNGFVRRYIL